MATVTTNALINGLSGKFGNALVFKTMRGKIFVSAIARKLNKNKESEAQRNTRITFKQAAAWAQNVLLDSEKKTYYQQRAKALKLPNAYTAAITDYMRKAKVVKLQHGNTLHYRMIKNGFVLKQVTATITESNGVEKKIEVHERNGSWIVQYRPDENTTTSLTFTITDSAGRNDVITTYG